MHICTYLWIQSPIFGSAPKRGYKINDFWHFLEQNASSILCHWTSSTCHTGTTHKVEYGVSYPLTPSSSPVTVLYYTEPYCTILYHTVPYCTVLYIFLDSVPISKIQKYKKTKRQKDKKTKKTKRQKDRKTERQRDRKTEKRQKYRKTKRQKYRKTKTQKHKITPTVGARTKGP